MYPLASKHHSSNEFPVLGPTVKSISHWDKVGIGPLESQSSSKCPGGKLKQDWDQQFTEILNMMQFAAVSDSPQRSKGPAHWAKDSHHIVSLWTLQWAGRIVKQRYSTTCFQYLLPIGSWSSLVNKQVLQVSQSQPVNLKEGSLWLRGLYDGDPFTPEWTSHSTARWGGGSGQGQKISCTRNGSAACPLNLPAVPQPNQLESHLLPAAKPSATQQKRDPHSGHVEGTVHHIQGNWLCLQQPAWLMYIVK